MRTVKPVPISWSEIESKLGLTLGIKAPLKPRTATTPTQHRSSFIGEMLKTPCGDGQRTQHLVSLIGTMLAAKYPPEAVLASLHGWNTFNSPPLDQEKIERTFASVLNSDQKNHPERYPASLQVGSLFNLDAGRIDRYLSAPPPKRRWLIPDLLVLGKAGAIVAPGGSSKSQLLLQLAVGVATGVPVAGHWQISETGSVLVFFAEDDDDEIHRRISRITERMQLEGEKQAISDLQKKMFVFSTIGKDTLLTKRTTVGEVSATHVVEEINSLARQIPDLKLIIIDPASRFRGGEENSNEDATRFVEALETIAKSTGATVLIAHHSHKGSYSADYEPSQGASRGASALVDGLRWMMNLNKPSEKQLNGMGVPRELSGKYVAATVTKTNYSATPPSVIFQRQDDGYLSVLTPTQISSRGMHERLRAVIKTLSTQKRPLTARQLEEAFGGVQGPLKIPKLQIREIVKLAKDRGFLVGAERQVLSITDLGLKLIG